jgi:hypothetical protein
MTTALGGAVLGRGRLADSQISPGAADRASTTLLYAFAAYSALTIVITFPLILNLSSRLPKDLGDPLLTASILWWNAHVTPLSERWWNGFGFFPATGMMAFSEHFLGAGLLASPLQWLGSSPVTAYNLTFLASFPVCAIAAHGLALTLTGRHDAAFVCGLAYGFNPYRVAHLEHLELLLAFGMPAALAALHVYVNTGRVKWLVAFAAALTIQVLCSSYYALFFTVLLSLWVFWFIRPDGWRKALAVVAAAGVSALAVAPIVIGYRRIHDGYELTRDYTEEILRFSGDLSSLVTASPLSAVWGWTAFMNGGERQLFPGLTITLLAVLGFFVSRHSRMTTDRLAMVSKACWIVAAGFLIIAIGARTIGPWRIDLSWLTVSVTVPYKPLSLSAAFAMLAIGFGARMRTAFRERSALAFYLSGGTLLFLCSLGPEPTLFGERILYEPPYAWLMRLPFFGDTIRVPARFAMLGALALSVAASLAFHRLTTAAPRGIFPLLVVASGVIADGWIREMPLPPVPERMFGIPPDYQAAAVLELPLGDVWHDTAAQYRATLHRARAVNGYNGYEPSFYQVLRRALDARNPLILDALASGGPVLIAVDRHLDHQRAWAAFLSRHPDVTRLIEDADWTLFGLPLKQTPRLAGCGVTLPIAAAFDARGRVDAAVLTDQNPATRWITSNDQRAGDTLTVDLGAVAPVCGVELSMGSAAVLYPGTLSVATSVDQVEWQTGFVGRPGGWAFLAALENPGDTRVFVPVQSSGGRFVRLRIEESRPLYPWAVANLVVEGKR